MIKTVISMMLVCAIMVQSKETITGVTYVICSFTKDCKAGGGLSTCDTKTDATLDVESCTDGKIKVLKKDSETETIEYENGKCNSYAGLASDSFTWTGGCGAKSGSIELATTVLFSMVVILLL